MIARRSLYLLAAAVVCLSSPVQAGSASATMNVTATVISTCTISSGNLTFGNYDAIGKNATAALTATAQISATCTQGATATIDIDAGLHPSGTGNAQTRRMKGTGATDYLTYDIYQDSSHNQRWGTKTSGTTRPLTGGGAGTPVGLTAYGSVPAAQGAPVGSYSDSVSVTVNY